VLHKTPRALKPAQPCRLAALEKTFTVTGAPSKPSKSPVATAVSGSAGQRKRHHTAAGSSPTDSRPSKRGPGSSNQPPSVRAHSKQSPYGQGGGFPLSARQPPATGGVSNRQQPRAKPARTYPYTTLPSAMLKGQLARQMLVRRATTGLAGLQPLGGGPAPRHQHPLTPTCHEVGFTILREGCA